MSLLFCAGDPQYWNFLKRSSSITTPTASPTASATYTLANLYDGVPGTPFQWGSYAASSYVTADLQLLTDGGAEDSGLAAWSDADTGGGVSSSTAVGAEVHSGSRAIKLDSTAGIASRSQDIWVRPGEALTVGMWSRGDAASGLARLRVQNLATGNFLTSGAAWQSAAATAISGATSATYAEGSLLFTMESYQACGYQDTVQVRLNVQTNSATGISYVDDLYLFPSVNLLSVHGHTIPAIYTLMMRSSTDNFGAVDTQEGTTGPAVLRPAAFIYLSTPVARRYWRLRIDWAGTTPSLPTYAPTAATIGEAVLAQATVLSEMPRHPASVAHARTERLAQVRNVTAGGATWVANLASQGAREVRLPMQVVTAAADREQLMDVWRRSSGGLYPMLLVPDHSEDVVVYGRLGGEWASSREFGGINAPGYRQELAVLEDALPAVGV